MGDVELTEDLATLLAEEQRLAFDRVDHDLAWTIGVALRDAALAEALPVAIAVRRHGQRLFHCGLPGSAVDNDAWLERKAAVVDRYGHSSWYVGCTFRRAGGSFDSDARLDPDRFAAHGGAYPLSVRGTGCIGTVAVSGLPQREDHALVVRVLTEVLARAGGGS